MTRKKMVKRVIKAIKALGFKAKLPIVATLAKKHIRGILDANVMEKLDAKYQRPGGCSCCYTSSIWLLNNQEIEIACGRLWGLGVG